LSGRCRSSNSLNLLPDDLHNPAERVPVRLSFVIFDIRTERQTARMSKVTDDGLTGLAQDAVPVWQQWTQRVKSGVGVLLELEMFSFKFN